MRYDLTICIPARHELFLVNTIQDILRNKRGKTQIIVGLDGEWPQIPVEDHPDVNIIHHSVSIGQRAIVNECVRLSRAEYICKVDAHCAFDEGFDIKLMADMQPELTMVPIMRNLHVFDWVCKKCGDRRYQGPTPVSCPKCDNTTDFERDIKWIAKHNPQSTAYCFDSEPHFQYFRSWKGRPESKGQITETMSLQGSCFLVTREKYHELNLCDETFGSWGSQGIEVAVKTWLSGGRVVCNKKTWYAHLFRTQGLDFGFPYQISGRQVDRAKKLARSVFFNNRWEKQVKPLSWLVNKFWPVDGWSDEARMEVIKAGAVFMDSLNKVSGVLGIVSSVPGSMADHTSSVSIDGERKKMTVSTMSLPELPGGSTIAPENILGIGNESKMSGITTKSGATDVMKNGDIASLSARNWTDKPSIDKTMCPVSDFVDPNASIPISNGSFPQPTPSMFFDSELRKKTSNGFGRRMNNGKQIHKVPISQNQKISKGLCFYTDNKVDKTILRAVQQRLQASMNGHQLVTVSLKPLRFGQNIVLDLRRGHLAMAKQQLAGIEALNTDIIFMVEHDVLYPRCHFDFTPPREDTFYYNLNWWKVRAEDGQALHFKAKQVSGLCAYRDILLEYYRNRVRMIESGEIGGRRHFEPGGRHKDAYDTLTTHGFDTWFSEVPHVDIRHGACTTRNIFDPSGYRGQVVDWTLSDSVPGWGTTKGRFNKFLEEVAESRAI